MTLHCSRLSVMLRAHHRKLWSHLAMGSLLVHLAVLRLIMSRATWWCPMVKIVAFRCCATSMGRTCAPSAAKEQETSSSMVPGAREQAPGPPLRTSNHAAAHTRQRRVQNRNCDTSKFVAASHPYQYDTSLFQRLRASHAILSTIMKRAFSTLCLNRARVRCGRLKQQQHAFC